MLISQQKITPRITDLLGIFKKQDKKEIQNLVRKYILNQHLYWTGSGREALRQILLDIKENLSKTQNRAHNNNNNQNNLKVGMPAFTCHVVLDAVKRAGCQPVFYDSGVVAEAEDIEKIINNVDALILCHNFGFLPNIPKIKELCQKNKVILIEDCAQALGAKFNNQLAGSFGDYAFYSFGISKNIGFCGGLIGSKHKLNIRRQPFFPTAKLIKIIGETIISPLFFNRYIYHYTSKLLKNELIKEQESLDYQLPNFTKKIILNQFKRYDQIIKKRRKNADYCIQELNRHTNLIKPIKQTNPAWLYFTLFSDNKEQLIHKLLKAGVELGEMQTFQCLDGKSTKAKEAEKHLTFALYRDEKEIKYIVDKIKRIINERT